MRSHFFRLRAWLPTHNVTPALEETAVLCGTSWSYETASTVLHRLTDASLCAKTIQSLTQRSAKPVKANAVKEYETAKRKAIKTALAGIQPASSPSGARQKKPPTAPTPPLHRTYLGFDGVFVPSRASPRGMEGKVAIVFTDDPEDRVEISKNRTLLLWKEYAGSFGPYRSIAERVYSLVWNLDLPRENLVVLGDGARWIRAIRNIYFPKAGYLLDWWHLKERVYDGLREIFPRRNERVQRQKLSESLLSLLWHGDLSGALVELDEIAPVHAHPKEALRTLTVYLTGNAEGIVDYQAWREMGRTVSSSIVEKTVDLLVARRCKHQGMVWSREGADAVTLLRAVVENDRWEQHCQLRRAAQQPACHKQPPTGFYMHPRLT